MDRHQVRANLLKITLLTLAATTWIFWSFIFATRPEKVEADPLTQLVRLPASLPTQLPKELPAVFGPQVRVNEPIEMQRVKLHCWDLSDEREQATSSRWIRLTGKTCQAKDVDIDSITVRNLTNGYVATVFGAQDKTMTTDFIPLQAGRNDILIRFNRGEGVAVESQFAFRFRVPFYD